MSTKSGSVESLKVSERCGCRPNAVQIRRIVVCERPVSLAIGRIDQCVASLGVDANMRLMTAAAWSSDTVRGRPSRSSSESPSIRCFAKRLRHFATVCSLCPGSEATSLLDSPVSTAQHHAASVRQGSRCLVPAQLSFQKYPFPVTQLDSDCRTTSHRSLPKSPQIHDDHFCSG